MPEIDQYCTHWEQKKTIFIEKLFSLTKKLTKIVKMLRCHYFFCNYTAVNLFFKIAMRLQKYSFMLEKISKLVLP